MSSPPTTRVEPTAPGLWLNNPQLTAQQRQALQGAKATQQVSEQAGKHVAGVRAHNGASTCSVTVQVIGPDRQQVIDAASQVATSALLSGQATRYAENWLAGEPQTAPNVISLTVGNLDDQAQATTIGYVAWRLGAKADHWPLTPVHTSGPRALHDGALKAITEAQQALQRLGKQ